MNAKTFNTLTKMKDRVLSWYTGKSIKYKLLLVIVSTLTVTFLLDFWGIFQLYSINKDMKQSQMKNSESTKRLEQFSSDINRYCEKEKDYIISQHKYEKQSIEAEMRLLLGSIQNSWSDYARNNRDVNAKKYIDELDKNWTIYLKLDDFILKYARNYGNLNEMIDMGAVFLNNNVARGQLIYVNSLLDKLIEQHKVAYENETNSMEKKYNRILVTIILFTLVTFVISAVISRMLVNSVVGPIFELTRLMKQIENGNLDVSSKITNSNEMGMLSNGFNHMVGRIKDLLKKVMQDQEEKRLAEIRILQHQINPHFLYHTLNSIRWMAKIYKAQNIDIMVTSLIKLLKSSIGSESELITIGNEIELLQCYFDIQKFRFIDKFDVEFDIEEQIKNCMIIRLLLQPIVENSLIHGIEPMKGKGFIRITGKRKGNSIEFIIRDNGLGMEEQALLSMFEGKVKTSSNFSGLGMKNVNERIKLYFGNDYGLTVESLLNVGTSVRLVIPAVSQNEDNLNLGRQIMDKSV